MCTKNEKCIPLQEQQTFCSLPISCCRYVEVKTGRSKWEKRTAVFVEGDGEPAKIIIYTYFLLGLGAGLSARGPVQDWRGRGKPLIGQIYLMNSLSKLEVKQEKNAFVVKLVTQKGLKLTLKFGGKEAAVWAAAVVCGNFSGLRHSTHGQAPDAAAMNMESDLRDKPNPNVYTGTRAGYVAPPKDASDGDKKKGSGKSDRNKKESVRKLKKTVSATKKSSSESKSQEKNTLATTQTLELTTAKADDGPANSGDSDPEHDGLKTKKTQTLTADATEVATKSGEAKPKQETPISMTPGTTQSVTPGSDDKEKKKMTITLTNSDENELPAKK